ncbi:MAG: CRISPR-associated helicase Cas3' [Bacteroidaceae bacterium]|nr:CRISPR-associated helicase Cas3' [Bacteroidaceae bacterium]
MKVPKYISHLKNNKVNEWFFQSNEEHSKGVAQLAASFAEKIGLKEWGTVLGMLHDKGKEQEKFQRYIRTVSGYVQDLEGVERTPHAYVGALLAKSLYPESYPILSMPIMAHHAGLYDYADFNKRMEQEIPDDIKCDDLIAINIKMPTNKVWKQQDFHHLIRVLYSCLVDADFLDTEQFMDNSRAEFRKKQKSLKDLLPMLESFLMELSESSEKTELNELRSSIQNRCKEIANENPGFYSLTVPTGGGKTLSSLVWAMNHAVKYGKDRIIIAIPYTSIIVQTASILRKIFGAENVLEHHSVFDADVTLKDYDDMSGVKLKQRLATENWDYPIVVTTNVQLFQSMLANKASVCRKLHNICNSVLILDEVQMLPTEYLQPIVDSLSAYQRIFNTSVLFTTASQPVLCGEHRGCNPMIKLTGLSSVEEIIPSEMCLHDKLRRVNLHFENEPISYDDLAERLIQYDKVLCIVNTRSDAQEIFSRLPKEGRIYHLSRMMCSAHIQKVIDEIKQVLKNPEEKVVRVVSTQLIEAGVDIDFPIVFRQEAGLDSILQAAGRCNREGKLGISDTYVFSLDKPLPLGILSKGSAIIKNMNVTDWFASDTMSDYFIRLYQNSVTFDKINVAKRMGFKEWCFELVAKEFQLIDDKGKSVIVNYGDSMELVFQMKEKGISYDLMRRMSRYMVNLREKDFQKLLKERFLEEISDGIYLLADRELYKSETGIVTDNHWLEEILIQ